jgi:dihydropteroate synthase
MSERIYLRPTALVSGPEAARRVAAGTALPLAGGPHAFTAVERIGWDGAGEPRREISAAADVEPHALTALTAARPAPFDRPRIMGILNVTPDSFSDGGAHAGAEQAIAHGLRLVAEGADIVDVGGESTRPGALPVPVAEELRRVLPVVQGLARAGVLVSIDSRKAAVMRAATAAGARMLNDVSGLAFDPDAPAAAAEAAAAGAWVVLMHMRGTPATMNLRPAYRACLLEVFDELEARIAAARAAGIPADRLILDPGLCFAKDEPHNVEILRDLSLLHGLRCPIMIGVSRKGWASWIESRHLPGDRLPSSLAAAQWALGQGARILRVHDVAATRQMMDSWATLAGQGWRPDHNN